MKNWYCILGFLLLSSFASYGQNVYQHFSELNGMEDYNGNTNLLYRINSVYETSSDYNYSNNIYLLNVFTNTDSLFQSDYSYHFVYMDNVFRVVNDYDFWGKNPSKFIVCGANGSLEPWPFIDRFDKTDLFHQFIGECNFSRLKKPRRFLSRHTFSSAPVKLPDLF